MIAQEMDSTLYRYGLIIDYNNTIANAVGFKFRQTHDIAYFIRGNISKENVTLRSFSSDRSEGVDTYFGFAGIEYSILNIDNISLLTILSGGLTISTYSRAYFSDQLTFIGNRDTKNIKYSLQTGIGAEYHISKHLSLSGSQSLALDYSTEDGFDGNRDPSTKTETTIKLVYAKLTLAFYF